MTRRDRMPHRMPRRLAGAGVAALLLFVGLLPFSPSASAWRAGCNGGYIMSAVKAVTVNHTGVELTRVYDEKGALNYWGDEPAATIAAHGTYHWCAYAYAFGTGMKAQYRFADGNIATLEAYSYTSGLKGSTCAITGPSADRYTCAHHTSGGQPNHVEADFVLGQRR